ncbi:MAG: hypothetical protein HPY69_05330 [Armatimonadetes bacterium]|nr:hypothetical protein [Armatimonadota bacterium]
MAQPIDPLTYLERQDKWYLGGGRATCFAPPFPLHLDALGFWDEAHFCEVPLPRLFTCFVVGPTGSPLRLRRLSRSWRPDRLRQTFECEGDVELQVREQKVVLQDDVFASQLTFLNRSEEPRELDVLVWSLRTRFCGEDGGTGLLTCECEDGCVHFDEVVAGGGRLYLCLGANQAPVSMAVNLCEPSAQLPWYAISTLPEKFRNGHLAENRKLEVGSTPAGDVHIALHYHIVVPPHERRELAVACAVAATQEQARACHSSAVQMDVVAAAVSQWRQFFEGIPYFSCSDPFLTRYYWYRWFGLRLCMVDAGAGFLPWPCVFEGIGGFRQHISYSAQCHMLECAWMHDPSYAQGSLLGFLDSQLDSGQLRGHLGLFQADEGFYHANWGAHALDLLAIHPDADFAARIYEPLCRYAQYFDRERDPEQSGLYDVLNQGETGQEYMPRYLAVDPEADQWKPIRLKGVDATVYMYQLKRALAKLAADLGRPDEAREWSRQADLVGQAILQHMWDPDREMFYDCDPETLKPTGAAAAVGFYPFLTDLCNEAHRGALRHRLLNPREFWLPCGPPSTSADDGLYSAQAEWKGKRMNCPWNGRMWPMTASHLCAALARAAKTHSPLLRLQAAELIRRFVHTMFFEQDPERPNCFEHYNPVTGEPSAYRGIDDYQHSWVVDLIIRHVAGLEPRHDDLLVVDPLDFDLREFELRRVHYRGHVVDIVYGPVDPERAPMLQVFVDGAERASREGLGRIEIQLP